MNFIKRYFDEVCEVPGKSKDQAAVIEKLMKTNNELPHVKDDYRKVCFDYLKIRRVTLL